MMAVIGEQKRRGGRPKTIGLPSKQAELLRLLASWPAESLPLTSAIASRLGLANESSVRAILNPLIAAGYVDRQEIGIGKLLKPPRLTEQGRQYLGLQPITPVGEIHNNWLNQPIPVNPASCGLLTTTSTEPKFVIDRVGDVFHYYREGDQAIIAVGDSMVSPDGSEESIPEDTLCLIRADVWPESGQTIYVEYELPNGLRECTLKDYFIDEETQMVILQARNPAYSDIMLPLYEILIRGVVIDLVKRPSKARRRVSAHK